MTIRRPRKSHHFFSPSGHTATEAAAAQNASSPHYAAVGHPHAMAGSGSFGRGGSFERQLLLQQQHHHQQHLLPGGLLHRAAYASSFLYGDRSNGTGRCNFRKRSQTMSGGYSASSAGASPASAFHLLDMEYRG